MWGLNNYIWKAKFSKIYIVSIYNWGQGMILKNRAEDFLQEFSFPISVAALMENLDLNITQSHTLIAIIMKFLTLHVGPLCQESTI